MTGYRLLLAIFFGVTTLSMRASAQLPPQGEHIQTNDYRVDLSQSPVVGSTRIIGLAGAYVAIAEGVDGISQNPAAAAVRVPWSVDHFDYDWNVAATFPSSIENSDFFNSGEERTALPRTKEQEFIFLNLGLGIQLGAGGLGLTTDLQQYGLNLSNSDQDELRAQISIFHLVAAHAFADGQFIIGAGLRSTALEVINRALPAAEDALFASAGAAPEAGLLWRPNDQPVRVGFAISAPVTTRTSTPDQVLYDVDPDDPRKLYLPNELTLPWQLNFGMALQLGPRPFNPRWIDPATLLARLRRYLAWKEHERDRRRDAMRAGQHSVAEMRALDAALQREAEQDESFLEQSEAHTEKVLKERYHAMSRSYLLLSTSLLVTGPSHNAVGIESFLSRTVNRSGLDTVVSPRFGAESEIWPHQLKLRGGAYIEPSRFRSNPNDFRVHGTLGAEFNVLSWSVFGLLDDDTSWRAGGVMDIAERFFGWGVAIGVWH